MNASKPHLIIPVENQVRELDAKLLLSCIAAQRGFVCVIGSRLEIDFRIASFPPGLYLSKSMTERSVKMFRIMRKLGHRIAAWDEEALVHPPADTYFTRRLSPVAIRHLSCLFAWGQDNADLWRQYPDLPEDLPIYITGNPRGDMLRPEMQGYFSQDAEALREKYGEFFLINTNFSNVNAFYPNQNLFFPCEASVTGAAFGLAAVGMTREFAQGLHNHKKAIFESFQRLIPELERALPGIKIVVRPHPTENPRIYHQIASRCKRVSVLNQGNVIPWLMAARGVIHNGCTTGIEAYIMRVPAVTYQAEGIREYDEGFYLLPNRLSHQCFDLEELLSTLKRVLSGELGAADGEERKGLMKRYLSAMDGPLASRRMVDVIESMVESWGKQTKPPFGRRLRGRYLAAKRRTKKRIKSYLPESKYRPEFQRHRYPGLSLDEMRTRIARFQDLIGDTGELVVERLSQYIFRIRK